MKARRLFRNDINGVNTMHDLYNESAGYNVIQFNRVIVKKKPSEDTWICIYQWRDGLNKELDKLRFDEFIKKYVEEEADLHFDPRSKVFLSLQVTHDNGLIMLADNRYFNFETNEGTGKLQYAEIKDFEFEIFYELGLRQHEPVYL